MKNRYRYFKRKTGIFYLIDKTTLKQKTLKTRDLAEAQKLVQAYNDAHNQAYLNLQLAKVYISGSDPKLLTRTWQEVMDHIVSRCIGETRRRWAVAIKDKNFDCIRNLKVIETRPEHFDQVLRNRKSSTNVYLRRIHNHALGMDWLLKAVLPKLLWPKPVFRKKRAITEKEHRNIIEAETAAARRNQGSRNGDEPHYDERRDFYELLWHIGSAQGDAAALTAENINWQQNTIAYRRRKLSAHDETAIKPAVIRFGKEVAGLLKRRPSSGPLFPYLASVRPGDRATEFKQRCDGLKIENVTLHSYRYAWAERALKCGYPERFAQQALGHNSKAVHHYYSKNADVVVPSLEDWETHWKASPAVHPLKPQLTTPSQPSDANRQMT